MTTFTIRLFGDPVLRQRAAEVAGVDDSVRKLIRDLTDTMPASGLGLAAPQIGITRRVFVWGNGDDTGALANPRLLESSGEVESDEGCLSLPGLSFPVRRAQWVRVEGLNESDQRVVIEATDLTARIFQHEIDHLDGVLFIDHLPRDLQREARRMLREQMLSGMAQTTSPGGL